MNRGRGLFMRAAAIMAAFVIQIAAFWAFPHETAAAASIQFDPERIVERLAELFPEPQPKTVNMAVVGDLMVHEWQANDAYVAKTGSYDFDYCFDNIRQYLTEPDFTVGNLETTFAGKSAGYSYYPTFNAPDEFGEALKNAGFDFLTTANNHSNDKRENGILRTIDVLDSLGIDHTGTFKTAEARSEVYIKEINTIKFAFLSYTYGTNGIPLAKPYLANLLEEGLIANDIARAKALNPDFIVVLPHMGNEYEQYPRENFKKQILSMFEAGADIVLASHPHVLQPMEFVDVPTPDGGTRRCFVAYSMGNFISSQRTVPRDTGMIINLEFERRYGEKPALTSVSYIPTWVKFVNAAGSYDIRILSVYDALAALGRGENIDLRPQDITRLKQVHKEVSSLLLGREVPIEEIKNEYQIFSAQP